MKQSHTAHFFQFARQCSSFPDGPDYFRYSARSCCEMNWLCRHFRAAQVIYLPESRREIFSHYWVYFLQFSSRTACHVVLEIPWRCMNEEIIISNQMRKRYKDDIKRSTYLCLLSGFCRLLRALSTLFLFTLKAYSACSIVNPRSTIFCTLWSKSCERNRLIS